MYVKWDSDQIVFGPSEQPQLDLLSNTEVKNLGWYRLVTTYIHPGHDLFETFDEDFHVVTNYTYALNEVDEVVEETKIVAFNDLDYIKNILTRRVNEFRDNYIAGTITYAGVTFDTDEKSRENLTGALSTITTQLVLAQSNPELAPNGIPWTINNNQVVTIEPLELINLTIQLAVFVSTCYGLGRYHKDNILNASTGEEAIDYAYSFGWPDRDLGGTLQNLN